MKRTLLAAFAAMALAAATLAHAEMPDSESGSNPDVASNPLITKLQDAAGMLQKGDAKGALTLLQAAASDPGFSSLSADNQLAAKADLGVAYYQLDNYAAALPYLREVSEGKDPDDGIWLLRYVSDANTNDFDDAALSLTTVAQRWPQSLAKLTDQTIGATAVGPHLSPERRAALLEALYAIHWAPQNPFAGADYVWSRLVLVRLDKGDVAGATEIAAKIADAEVLARMMIDARYDAVVKADPGHYDITKASAQNIADMQRKSAAAPDKIEGVNEVARMLIISGRAAEALPRLDDALRRAAADSKAFSDAAKINWTENFRAYALQRLGRMDEFLAQMTSAAKRSEDGVVNVSQAINLADAYNTASRPHDALDAVASPGPMSPFGQMQLMGVRACAYAQLKDDANLKQALDYLNAHAADSPGGAGPAFLCANDLDSAAKAYIAELDDPDTRAGTLYELQDFTVAHPRTGFDKDYFDRFTAMKARPDVAAAVAKYGRIVQIPLDPLF